jgi:hypothetical protein
MDLGERPARRGPPPGPTRFEEIVPPRAVLTELARGFLLSQGADPERAKRFASSFLREQAGRSGTARIIPVDRRARVRRGLALALDGDEVVLERSDH